MPLQASLPGGEIHLFIERVVRPWNMLPREEVIVLSLVELKQHGDNALTCVV